MAQKTIVTMVDDLTGEVADSISTVEFELDGRAYELDLTEEKARSYTMRCPNMSTQLERFGGRRRSGPRTGRSLKSTSSTTGYNRETLKSIREWAKKNGHSVSDRGRLTAEVLQSREKTQAAMSEA